MTNKVLDSWALIALFEDEPAADAVENLLHQATLERHRLFMSVANWGEVYYNTMREVSREAAEQRVREIGSLPIDIVGVSDDLAMARQAAIYKATKKLSYADCFGAALARIKNAEFVTGDPEFKELEEEIKINWLK
jgi:predicted nucleic acid-binding protein